jgi:hypothetical protein
MRGFGTPWTARIADVRRVRTVQRVPTAGARRCGHGNVRTLRPVRRPAARRWPLDDPSANSVTESLRLLRYVEGMVGYRKRH